MRLERKEPPRQYQFSYRRIVLFPSLHGNRKVTRGRSLGAALRITLTLREAVEKKQPTRGSEGTKQKRESSPHADLLCVVIAGTTLPRAPVIVLPVSGYIRLRRPRARIRLQIGPARIRAREEWQRRIGRRPRLPLRHGPLGRQRRCRTGPERLLLVTSRRHR